MFSLEWQGVWHRFAQERWIAVAVFVSCAYFFQGGGWNQNAHFATTVAMVENGTMSLDRYRNSTGDLARAGAHVVSAKPIGTALFAIPAYLVARTVTLPMSNHGNRVIVRAYLTALGTSGLALVALAVILFRLLRRRVCARDASALALALTLATPLWPNSTMLNSHALVSLFAISAYTLLERGSSAGELGKGRLFVAGVLAALPTAFEYMAVVVVLPLGIYALWQASPRMRMGWFVLGGAVVALVPLLHHTLVYGDPLHVGYSSLVVERFAADAGRGFMGFDGFSLARLHGLTFGVSRGIFVLSPFLLAGVAGLVVMIRDPQVRAEGVVSGGTAWMVLVTVASLAYWHSGSSVGSRYALLFIPFSAVPIAAIFPRSRGLIALGIIVGFALMVMATSVTAIPPTPPARPPYPNVLHWWWERFSVGNLASWKQRIITEEGLGNGSPTMPFAFNLGQLIGLPGLWSIVPYGVLLVVFGWRSLSSTHATRDGDDHQRDI